MVPQAKQRMKRKHELGGCDGQIPNYLPILPGWNYVVRLCRPRTEILNSTWEFSEAQPAPKRAGA